MLGGNAMRQCFAARHCNAARLCTTTGDTCAANAAQVRNYTVETTQEI
jgi:hypothetical protein